MVSVREKANGFRWVAELEKAQRAVGALSDLDEPEKRADESECNQHESQISALTKIELEATQENTKRRNQRQCSLKSGIRSYADGPPSVWLPNRRLYVENYVVTEHSPR